MKTYQRPQNVALLALACGVAATLFAWFLAGRQVERESAAEFRSGAETLTGPQVNYPANRFDTQVIALAGCEVLVVEGTYVLQLADVDIRVFLEATWQDTEGARRARNRDIDAPFVAQVLAIEHGIIAKQVAQADIVIDRDYRVARRCDTDLSAPPMETA